MLTLVESTVKLRKQNVCVVLGRKEMKKSIMIACMIVSGFASVAMNESVNPDESNNSGSHQMYEINRADEPVFYEGELTQYQFGPNWESMILNVQVLKDNFSEVWDLSHLKSLVVTGRIGFRRKLLEKLSLIFLKSTNLEELFLNNHQLAKLPQTIGNLSCLKKLSLIFNSLAKLPRTIENLSNLESLILYHNRLNRLPQTIGNLRNLRELNLRFNNLEILPDSIRNLVNLDELLLGFNNLSYLPPAIGHLENLRRIDLQGNGLVSLGI